MNLHEERIRGLFGCLQQSPTSIYYSHFKVPITHRQRVFSWNNV